MEKLIQITDFQAIFSMVIKSQGRIKLPEEYVDHECIVIISKEKVAEGKKEVSFQMEG